MIHTDIAAVLGGLALGVAATGASYVLGKRRGVAVGAVAAQALAYDPPAFVPGGTARRALLNVTRIPAGPDDDWAHVIDRDGDTWALRSDGTWAITSAAPGGARSAAVKSMRWSELWEAYGPLTPVDVAEWRVSA